MNAQELRKKFIKFFEEKGHKHLPSSSLIPQDDPQVLLTTAGMQQFKKWFIGIEKPTYPKVVTIQKCVRIDDIEEVGDETHLSFFEMLGNFSFGDYFKKDAIKWGIEFLQDELGISSACLSFTYFKGDKEISKDEESLSILKELKIPEKKIKPMGREDNFWGPTGDEGPCGPTVEIYVDDIEVWNLVFNEYYRISEGKYKPLKMKGVDTGLGFERMLAILNSYYSVYQIDDFRKIINSFSPQMYLKEEGKAIDYSSRNYSEAEKRIADHVRAAVFLLADGVKPSNLDKGYVLRKLITRSLVLFIDPVFSGIKDNSYLDIAEEVIKVYTSIKGYENLFTKKKEIISEFKQEKKRLDKISALRGKTDGAVYRREKVIARRFSNKNDKNDEILLQEANIVYKDTNSIALGKMGYHIESTYGYPALWFFADFRQDKYSFEREYGRRIVIITTETEKGLKKAKEYHQKVSRRSADKKFKGGLASGGEQETRYHTATHLLHQALRAVLGDHVKQAGSNITTERLRFDFTHPEKMTPEQITEVEKLVNEEIKAKLPVICEEMTVEEAKKQGAIGLFEAKYGDKVKIYSIGPLTNSGSPFSREICGGPHAKNTSELGHFKIKKEQASSSGVRRIKAILE